MVVVVKAPTALFDPEMYMSVVEFAEATIVRPARVFQLPETKTLTVALVELARETAPMVLLDPLT